MKKGLITIAVIAVIAVALFGWVKGAYNGLVKGEEGVEAAWAQVENVYQRRADLIPNLVATVKGYAAHESETLQAVIDARAKATGITVDASNLSEEALAKFQSAQGELTQALGRLIAVSESYPDLKANQNFLELQSQLEGTENRITVERNKFNETAQGYNTNLRSFPTNIIAGLFNFEKKGYFKAAEGAETAPKVEF
ncbi:MAG: LemA family protein [Bacteroidales bacterium]|jgi:LemA protein|nr:LemA family protein [Bacteroidales bacterium]MEE3407480.1 LemA family protein [Candidatus Cryptobacteroides sp.]SKC56418.1 LemA protein [Bacteroidales bacterium WCE2008]MBO7365488.1 LemA family protein [Bacteroidales bacterium]MBO7623058.1 LemA family protein [Bacteroidales bacterium]